MTIEIYNIIEDCRTL